MSSREPAAADSDDVSYRMVWDRSLLSGLCADALAGFAAMTGTAAPSRMPGDTGEAHRAALLSRYSALPAGPVGDPAALARELASDMYAGAVQWRSPQAFHNVGSAVNAVSAAVQSLALALNVNMINDDQGGNSVLAEQAVGRVLADLAGVDPDGARALFTFGGTGTVLYGMKAGLCKAAPQSARQGTPADVVVVTVAGAHFAALRAADWLGVGSDRVLTVPVGPDLRADLVRAEALLDEAVKGGARIAAIMCNGGTTLDHTVDDIAAFAALRDRLVARHRLDYRPHLHVDAVIGWPWLFFGADGCDPAAFTTDPGTARDLAEQHRRIAAVGSADSWGVDFHKGPGSCPLDSSCVVFNDAADLHRLAAGVNVAAVGPRRPLSNIAYTLETARQAGKAVSALAALHALGASGFCRTLATLVGTARQLRAGFAGHPEWTVLNPETLGYQTMLRAHPPGMPDRSEDLNAVDAGARARIRSGNEYLAAFFAWDDRTRMSADGGGVLYSFCPDYRTAACGEPVAGLKFYPVSPLTDPSHAVEASELLIKRKAEFDALR